MSHPVIEAHNLGKRYRIRHQSSTHDRKLRHAVTRLFAQPWKIFAAAQAGKAEDFWALREVSLTVNEGAVLGIVGRNGAGKTTLLKLLSRITRPTEGRALLWGRVASLLEVGTGFHPELTGRENIFLNGSILGMTRAEVRKKFDAIVDFAGVENFIDTPVKRYSSGMYVRLAFAVAAHLEPEILLVDEVLAVGDLGFQRKCLGKMDEVAKGGRTVLFVSHNMASLRSLCQEGILLNDGQLVYSGSMESTIENYTNLYAAEAVGHTYQQQPAENPETKAELLAASICNAAGEPAATVNLTRPFSVAMTYRLNTAASHLIAVVEICDTVGTVVISTTDIDASDLHGKARPAGIYREKAFIPPLLLMPGAYSINAYVIIPKRERLVEQKQLLRFEIVDHDSHLSQITGVSRPGYISTPLQWEVNYAKS
ncbi:MAG: ABC transporter ATP-binding protein [Planctomycetes bacterium]|nr:ABC transporter ATP-binding protein [Planctomycetota bacterium]